MIKLSYSHQGHSVLAKVWYPRVTQVAGGSSKTCPHIPGQLSPQKVESNSPPSEYGLDLVTCW